MISFNKLNFKFDETVNYKKIVKEYDNYVDSIMGKAACPFCHSHNIIKHSKYKRTFINHNDDTVINMLIQRVICKQCGKTHAIIPPILVPYKRKTIYNIKEIIDDYESNVGIPSNDYSIIKTYKTWKDRISNLMSNIKDIWNDYISFLAKCAKCFSMCFMQGKRHKYSNRGNLYEVIYSI